jgi:protein-S-isoprenylcysteine O-methyltransferase Ste14
MRVGRLFAMPIIFILMSLNNLDGSPKMTWLAGFCWFLAIVFGIFLGYLHKRNANITVDRSKGIISIPGDLSMLLLIMVVFAVEFAINAVEAFGSSPNWWFGPLALGVSGLATGMALGRNGTFIYRYFNAK